MKAKDIMHKRVVTVTPNMTLREAAALFDDHHITGMPVVGTNGMLVGLVSQSDLVRHERESAPTGVSHYPGEPKNRAQTNAFHIEEPDYTRVEQVMTPWTISFEEDTPIEDIARQMLAKRIHRVVITRQGKLCGIVSTMDVIRAFLARQGKAAK